MDRREEPPSQPKDTEKEPGRVQDSNAGKKPKPPFLYYPRTQAELDIEAAMRQIGADSL